MKLSNEILNEVVSEACKASLECVAHALDSTLWICKATVKAAKKRGIQITYSSQLHDWAIAVFWTPRNETKHQLTLRRIINELPAQQGE